AALEEAADGLAEGLGAFARCLPAGLGAFSGGLAAGLRSLLRGGYGICVGRGGQGEGRTEYKHEAQELHAHRLVCPAEGVKLAACTYVGSCAPHPRHAGTLLRKGGFGTAAKARRIVVIRRLVRDRDEFASRAELANGTEETPGKHPVADAPGL